MIQCDALQEIQSLFLKDCLVAGRTLLDSSRNDSSSFPIFNYNERNRLEFKWRSIDSYVVDVNNSVLKLYGNLNSFVCDPKNQLRFKLKPNQILVLDNRALCHGRTSFPSHQRRTLWRTNYMNDGRLSAALLNGFDEAYSHSHLIYKVEYKNGHVGWVDEDEITEETFKKSNGKSFLQ